MKALQQAVREQEGRKRRIDDFLVLAPKNDPYYCGSVAQVAMAEWFADAFGAIPGQHLRRVHYRLVARGDVVRSDGRLYENDKNSWEYLNSASRYARYLGLVDPEDIVDRRNPEPYIYMAPGLGEQPRWSYELVTNDLMRISTRLGRRGEYFPLVGIDAEVEGYFYEQAMQPYHCELWAEKTTANDVLIPLCSELGANYVSGAGYMSITAMVKLLRERVRRLSKPCRVVYVSDYDSAGQNMPKQMARQMQFWIEKYAAEYDIRVEPIVMTEAQAADYPAAPDSGAVELDAMLELDPGRLERIVREHVAQFRDFDLFEKFDEAEQLARETVAEAVEDAISEEREDLEEVEAEAEQIYQRYRPRLEALAHELDAELEPLDERVETLQQAVREKLEALEPNLPALPAGEPEEEPGDDDWLFDSSRDYLTQLQKFKER